MSENTSKEETLRGIDKLKEEARVKREKVIITLMNKIGDTIVMQLVKNPKATREFVGHVSNREYSWATEDLTALLKERGIEVELNEVDNLSKEK